MKSSQTMTQRRHVVKSMRLEIVGDMETIGVPAGNQQSAAAQRLSKNCQCIDAVLVHECLKGGIDPGDDSGRNAAAKSMADAAKQFFRFGMARLRTLMPERGPQLAAACPAYRGGSKEIQTT